ncbi:SDR family NAD(P)-dependent oxidoreductase [Gorillibacterium sp. sgz5001074]|uniref:SDR family NAD(P)-dependent oxidoreductase n=1 Tax=Gorillibacterium sp. sgz5001074 TaxID=3446695 RepID=UPI003F6717C5
MRRDLSGQVTVITGASGGLGMALAEEFHKRGAWVVLAARSLEKLREAQQRLGGDCMMVKLDVTQMDSVQTAVQDVLSRTGRIDIWINNAGYGRFETLDQLGLDDLEGMMDVNYMGLVRCTKAVLPSMLQAGSGSLVQIASMAGKMGSAKGTGYCASKHAVLGFANSLRQELAGTGVSVTSVNPGPIDTPFFDVADPSGNYVKNVKWFMLKPETVASRVADAVERNRKEIDLPLTAAVGVKLYQLFPRLLDRVAVKLLNQK